MKVPPSIVVELIHIHGPMKGEIQEFSDGYITIGRHPSCSVRFQSDVTNVSRNHADITREGNQFKLVDHSTNGTYLNGRKVTEAYLKDGDVLEFSEGGPKVSFIAKVVAAQDDRPPGVTQHDDQAVLREEIVQNIPAMDEGVQPLRGDKKAVAPPASYQPPPAMPSSLQQPVSSSVEELPAGKVSAPLVIQFGTALRSYHELPVSIGSNPSCGFVLTHPAILGQHAQIVFARGQYWIKDLTGQGQLRVNNSPISFQAPLNIHDQISLAPQGPALCFLGEGRFAEAVESAGVAPVESEHGASGQQSMRAGDAKEVESLWDKLKRRF